MGLSPDPAGFARYIADLLRAAGEKRPTSVRGVRDEGATAVLPDGTELRFAGDARRILDALARAHAEGAVGLSVRDLVAQGWPDERIRATAATNRAYVTVNRMRAAGGEHRAGLLVVDHHPVRDAPAHENITSPRQRVRGRSCGTRSGRARGAR